jgi:hypothetical protein
MQGGTALCQTYTLPSVLFDSMVFEVRRGRSCDSLQILNDRIIESQGTQLLNYDKLVKTMDAKVSTLEALVENRKEATEKLTQQFNQDRKALKRKVRIRNLVILGEAVITLILIL